MTAATDANQLAPDPAAVLGAAVSLWQACLAIAGRERGVNLSECYNGGDQWMREVMRVAVLFEEWACSHVAFNELGEVWPYFLEEEFGPACLGTIDVCGLADFDQDDCLRVAMHLRLPVVIDGTLPVPVSVHASNPLPGAELATFRIQSVRDSQSGTEAVPYDWNDEPYDQRFGAVYFVLYGTTRDGRCEHIADRSTYVDAVNLCQLLVPGISFKTSEGVSRDTRQTAAGSVRRQTGH